MSVLHAKFDVKTVMNEEIPVNEWQKKIKKMSKLAEMMFILYSSKILGKTEVFPVYVFYGTSCTSERLKESTLALLIVEIST